MGTGFMDLYGRDINTDVRELGAVLGEVLHGQRSEAAFESVETLRRRAIEHRAGESAVRSPVAGLVSDLTDEDALVVARAFTTYFELINLAEERERVRTLREQEQVDMTDGGLEEAAATLADVDSTVVQRVLGDVLIQPTFTAHPTEARRKTVKSKLGAVAADLEALDERRLTDGEEDRIERRIRAEVTNLWQTRQVRNRQPDPFDEVTNVQWYLENTLFDVIGDVYGTFERTLAERVEGDVDVPKLFEFRSWAGGDRDGNPHVTSAVTARTLDWQRSVVLEQYDRCIEELSAVLSLDGERIELGDRVADVLDANGTRLSDVARTAAERYEDEPYRQYLLLVRARLDLVAEREPGGYASADDLRDKLAALAADLRTNDAATIAEAHVDPLIRQVETFGFALASLDLRDHRQSHTTTLCEVLARHQIDYAGMDEVDRVAFLTGAILGEETILDLDATDGLSETATRVLTRFVELDTWQREFGSEAIDTYCISMCEEPSHVLEVLFLADQAGVVDLPERCELDLVPLLETEYALSGARRIMGTLFGNDAYATSLSARDDVQEIMLGYSDSNKENGYLAAQWSLYRNQKRLADICADFDVDLRLFHGRGGTISRGGGPMNDALLALPNETVSGRVKFTEQGEAIAEKYANPRIAERELEQMANAQIRARLDAIENPTEPVDGRWLDAMAVAAEAAREAYRDLIATDGFVAYFEQVTPISVIEDLNLGSRPASRTGHREIEDLRAIPWVFSWTQSRCILPGWYSMATGFDAYLADGGDVETLREMYQSWPFFRTVVDNASLALARTDMDIATAYAGLADVELRERFFPPIGAEYERSVELIARITGREDLPLKDWLVESMERRNPYVDPLNTLQVRLLDRDDRSPLEERTVRLTVKGIAAGMKNTG